ncbi:MAG: fluoride efflux transporter CrcB [Vicinamibacterales bacterium]
MPTLFEQALAVALGGAIGSTSRYVLTTWLVRADVPAPFPSGTFIVNVVGCVVYGLLIGMAEGRALWTHSTRAFLLAGVLGGFTTFSAFTYETFYFLRHERWLRAAADVVGQVTGGLVGLGVGMAVGRLFRG